MPMESSNKIVTRRRDAVERLVIQIVDTLLYYNSFEDYWISHPFGSQSGLEGLDFLRGRRVPAGAVREIATAIDAYVTDSRRGAARRSAA